MEVNNQKFSPMKIMADRDFEIESKINDSIFSADVEFEWNVKFKIMIDTCKQLFYNNLRQECDNYKKRSNKN